MAGVDVAHQQFDRIEMLKAFDETQAGVKDEVEVPLIDLSDFKNPEMRKRIVEQVRAASETWGFFQVVNHGIPSNVSDAMIDGIKRFNEMDVEEKRKYYSRDSTRKTNSAAKNCPLLAGTPISSNYYPACPEPELTLGTTMHSDLGFITLLLQNHISGLQVLYQDRWLDVEPIPGGLVINIGDLLQLVSNGKFKSSKHRVVANSFGPRISVACFIGPNSLVKSYAPITELISEENPAKYREVILGEYLHNFVNIGLDEYLGLDYYKL
ncbi:hypothetical protein C2S52_022850 [Perilla frutescens var. hirtella]|nr:hypothetical protein C2S52_022850 [Perilla frutescens var. hirtella]